MPKKVIWTAVGSSLFILISVLESLAGSQEVALVTAVNAVALAILALKDN